MLATLPQKGLCEAEHALAEGVSITLGKDEDNLKLRLSKPVVPKVKRYGNTNRIVVEFEGTTAAPSINDLVKERRGSCVERFEVQMFKRRAVINPSGGIRQMSSPTDMLIIAYVESDVEIDVDAAGKDITLYFYRIGTETPQSRPLPINYIEQVGFYTEGIHQALTIEMSEANMPSLFEELNPHRLILTFPDSQMTERAKNQIKRYMQTPAYIMVEGYNINSLPKPYDNEVDSRQDHFVGGPSPLESNDFEEMAEGIQSRGTVITIFPAENTHFTITKRGGTVFEIIFTRHLKGRDHLMKVYSGKKEIPDYYPMEDELGREIVPDFNAESTE